MFGRPDTTSVLFETNLLFSIKVPGAALFNLILGSFPIRTQHPAH